jgi:hypothetical protein
MKNLITIQKIILFALLVEAGIIIIQLAYMAIFHPELGFAFNDYYMQNVGFFMYILLARYIITHSGNSVFRNAVILFLSGIVFEVGFYMIIQASYEGAFLFSILDKFVAIAFGLIIVQVVEKKEVMA